MITPEIIRYVKGLREEGYGEELIRGNLKESGWTDENILEILSRLQDTQNTSLEERETQTPQKSTEITDMPIPQKGQVEYPNIFALCLVAWNTTMSNFFVILKINFLGIIPIILFIALWSGINWLDGIFGFSVGGSATFSDVIFVFNIVAQYTIIILLYITMLWMVTSTLILIKSNESKMGAWELCRKAQKYIGGVFWISLLTGFAVIGGSILFIVPGVIIKVLLMFSVFVYLLKQPYSHEFDLQFQLLVKYT